MLHSRKFVKKTRRGGIVTSVREHYLREDIACGSAACQPCGLLARTLAAEAASVGAYIDGVIVLLCVCVCE